MPAPSNPESRALAKLAWEAACRVAVTEPGDVLLTLPGTIAEGEPGVVVCPRLSGHTLDSP